jgi:hypothetical protein
VSHLPLIASFTFITDCQCHIYHRLSVLHLPLNISVTFTTECQFHIYNRLLVPHLLLIVSGKCDTYNQWQMWLWQSVVNVTLTISGKCDTWNQRFSMAIHRHYYNLHCTSLHTFMPSIKLFLLRKIILLSIRIQLLQVGSNKTLLEKLPWRQYI